METNAAHEDPSSYVSPEVVSGSGGRGPPGSPPPGGHRRPGGWFGRFGRLVWIALAISIVANVGQRVAYENYFLSGEELSEKFHSGSRRATSKVAILRVEGALLESDGFVKHQIDQVRRDKQVKAVVLRVDSPGGTVSASDYVYHHLTSVLDEREIPMVVSMGGLCASGGYYVAMAVGDAEQSIFAEPTSWTGSIGVIIPHYDVSDLLEHWHIQDDSIASHPLKQLGSPTRKLNEEERADERKILQTMVDESFRRFKEVVRAGRPAIGQKEDVLDAASTGQIFTTRQALELGLVDRIGFLEDAVTRATELAGLEAGAVRVVKYTRHVPGVLEAFTGTEARATRLVGSALRHLADMTAPRAYYLCTWIPASLDNRRP